jgi:hypothetical protein
MVFPIAGGNESKGYEVENSLRFNASDSPQLSKDMSGYSNATNTKKFTTSFWLKLGNVPQTSYGGIIDVAGDHTISLFSDNTFYFFENGGSDLYWRPTRVFRDPSAWYNIIIIADSTLSTQTDRVKIYVNGVRETSFHNNSGPNQNHDFAFNTVNTRYIGRKQSTSSSLDGYLTEIHHIDGQAKAHTDFGEFDDNGVWIPIKYEGTYGDTGYYLEFKQTGTSQNSSGIGADTSGEDNHFAVSNLAATDVTEDTCTNNFVTLNPITPVVTHTLSEGNCKSTNSSGTHGGTTATINLPTSGKWYWEVKIEAESSDKGQGVGIGNQIYRSASDWGNYPNMIIYLSDGTKQNESGYASYGNAHNADDIIGVAYNADDQELTFYHNNSSQGTIPTSEMDGEIDFDNVSIIVFGRNVTQSFNFGNPPYSISSGNTDGKYGNFEYAPPSGYYALCTKRLAEFG